MVGIPVIKGRHLNSAPTVAPRWMEVMAMRLINADKVNPSDAFVGMSDFAQDCRNAVVELLNTQLIIDPVHAAGGCYCRECKRYLPDHICGWNGSTGWLPDDFCSYGRPKEDGL